MYKPTIEVITYFEASDIIFDDSNDVTVYGMAGFEDGDEEIILSLDFTNLNELLSSAGDDGKRVAEKIGDVLSKTDDAYPVSIDLYDILDHSLVIDTLEMRIYHAMEENGEEGWEETEENIYFLDEFDELDEDDLEMYKHKRKLNQHLETLSSGFEYYESLKEIGFSEEDARNKAGLTDPFLFKLALHNYYSR